MIHEPEEEREYQVSSRCMGSLIVEQLKMNNNTRPDAIKNTPLLINFLNTDYVIFLVSVECQSVRM